MQNFLAFGTFNGAWFLVLGVLNTQNLAFSTFDSSAFSAHFGLGKFSVLNTKVWNKSVRLNLINHLVGFIPCQICLYFRN